jgi:hypothetical protein
VTTAAIAAAIDHPADDRPQATDNRPQETIKTA